MGIGNRYRAGCRPGFNSCAFDIGGAEVAGLNCLHDYLLQVFVMGLKPAATRELNAASERG